MKTPSRWLRFLAFINYGNSRKRLGGMRAARTRKERLGVKVVADQTLPPLSVQRGAQK